MKFLGLTYDGETDKLWASTRKGANIPVPDHIRTYMAESDNPMLPRILEATNHGVESREAKVWISVLAKFHEAIGGLSWQKLAGSATLGFVMSKLYQGSFDMEKIKQNFELTHTGGS